MWNGIAGCVVHVDVRGECVSVLYAETVNSAGCAWYVGSFKLCCEILLLLNVAESSMDCLLCAEGCGASRAEYRVHLVSVV